MKKTWNGFIIKVGRFYYWKFKNPLTGKYTQRVIRNAEGASVSIRSEAETIVRLQTVERRKIEALESKAEYLTKIAELKRLIRVADISLDDIWTTYLHNPTRPDSGKATLKGYQDALSLFLHWLKSNYPAINTVQDISPRIAEAFAVSYWSTGISEQTYNARIGACKLIFRILAGDENPFREIRKKHENKQSRNAFSLTLLQAISALLEDSSYRMLHKEQMKLMMLIMLYTGCRGEDACLMKWESIDLTARQITYIPLKTARRRTQPLVVPMADVLHEALESAMLLRHNEYVLPDVADRYLRIPSGISKDISKLLQDAGIQTTERPVDLHRKRPVIRYSMHSFRHTFCTLSINRGISLPVIQSIVGHSTALMTSHYSHISIESKRNAIQAISLLEPSINS